MGTDGVLKNERGERLVVELTFADSSVLMTNVCSILPAGGPEVRGGPASGFSYL